MTTTDIYTSFPTPSLHDALPISLHHPRPITLDDPVGALAQLARDLDRVGLLHVERDRRPVAAQRIARIHEAAGTIDADHLGAMVGEHHPAEGAGTDPGKFDDPYAFERACHIASPIHFVIASGAKQSRAVYAGSGLLRRFAPRNDGSVYIRSMMIAGALPPAAHMVTSP